MGLEEPLSLSIFFFSTI